MLLIYYIPTEEGMDVPSHSIIFVVQFPSCVWLFVTHWTVAPDLPVPHHLPKFAQVHVHCIRAAIQQSYPLMPSSSALSLAQLQCLFQWIGFSHQVAKYWSFSFSISNEYPGLISFRMDGWIALLSKGLSRVFSSITIQKHRFFSTQPSLWSSLLYGPTLWSFTSVHDYSKKHSFDYTDLCRHSDVSDFLIHCLGLSYLFFQGASIF